MVTEMKNEMKNKVNILGTEYALVRYKAADDPKLDECDGYCDTSVKLIVVEDYEPDPKSKNDLEDYAKQVMRHEIIHAFMFESGLDSNGIVFDGAWPRNEEMIDWFAIQSPKIFKAFEDVGCL